MESGTKPEDDTLYDLISSETIDQYTTEFESATDQDIGSILEEMSKLADTISSSSASDGTNLRRSGRNDDLQEKSLEELLEEAEELMRRNSCCISEKILKSHESDSDCNIISSTKMRNLDTNIFQRIEEEVRRESEKNKNSPNRAQNKTLQDQAEQSPGSPGSPWFKSKEKTSLQKNNLKKELTDVDENFFVDVSNNSEEDFENENSNDLNSKQEKCSSNCTPSIISKVSNEKSLNNDIEKSKGKTDTVLEEMMPDTENLKTMNERIELSNDNNPQKMVQSRSIEDNIAQSVFYKKHVKKSSQNTSHNSDSNKKTIDLEISDKSKKELDLKSDLYTVDLTPRLELFADAIPKLVSENSRIQEQDVIDERKEIQNNIEDSSQNITLKETNPIPITPTKEVIICPTTSKESEETKKNNSMFKPVTNLEFPSTSQKPSRTVNQRKKLFPKVKVISKNNSNLINKVKLPLKARKDNSKNNAISKLFSSAKSNQINDNLSTNHRESLCHKEEQKNCPFKKQLDLNEKFHKAQMKSARSSFDEELFSLKKQNIVLKDKIDELLIKRKKPEFLSKNNRQIRQLEKELEDSKKLAESLGVQKKKFVKNTEVLKQEVNKLQQKIVSADSHELQRQMDYIKKLQEEICELNLELAELKQQNLDHSLQNDDIVQQNCLLKDELKVFKEQLKEKNNFIAERLQTLTTTEMKLKKQVENLKLDLNKKAESLKVATLNNEKLEQTILPLEQELLEMRVKEGNLQEKLGLARNHAEREKQLSLKLKNQVILDTNKIMDLTRQVREMERIIRRKNPDSVSALLLTANSEQDRLNLDKIKLLEIRNRTLESEIKVKEETAQQRLADFRNEFAEMKKKYTIQIVDLEEKFLSASFKKKQNNADVGTQTMCSSDKTKKVETGEEHEQIPGVQTNDKKELIKIAKVENLKLQSKKNDINLVTTICKLKLELSNKNKALTKLTKEFQELQKTNKRLQKEREKQLNDMRSGLKNADLNRKNIRALIGSEKDYLGSKSSEIGNGNSNGHSNGHSNQCELRLQDASPATKVYDPLQYYENSGSSMTRKIMEENSILKEEISKLKADFMVLKNKRMRDLNLLQEEHERELTALIQKYSAREKELNALKLEGKRSHRNAC